MADSRQYRKKYYLNSGISLVLLVAVLSLLGITADETSGLKMDFTRDRLYTISDATKSIFGQLKDKVKITYYCSEELPSFLATIVRDTEDQFEELRKISDGNLQYEIVNPDDLAERKAMEATDAYMVAYKKKEYEGLEEPEPPMDIPAMMAGRKQDSPKQIREGREAKAKKEANEKNIDADEAYRDILLAEYKEKELRGLAQSGVTPYMVADRTANSVKQLRVYSAIKVSYLNRPAEIIRFHTSLESLEYEMAYRIVKLTQGEQKPVVAFFDSRKPPAPPVNPARPTPPPPSEYSMIISYLQELVDVREISLKEGDAIDDLVKSVKGDADRKLKEASGEEASGEVAVEDGDYTRFIKCLIVAQPHELEDRQVYEINRAVSMGIPTVFLVSPYTINVSDPERNGGLPITILRTGLEDLFKDWGVILEEEMLASNEAGPIMYPREVIRGFRPQLMPMPANFVLSPSGESFQSDSILTNRIAGLALPGASGMRLTKIAGLTTQELVNSGKHSWSVKIDPLAGMNPSPFNQGRPPSGPSVANHDELMGAKDVDAFEGFVKPVPLIAYLEGKFPFRFEGESVPEWKKPPAGGGADPHSGIPGLPPGFPPGVPPGVPPGRDGDLLPDPSDPLGDETQEEVKKPAPAAPITTPVPETPAVTPQAPIAPAVPVQEKPGAAPQAPATPAVPVEAAKAPEPAKTKAPAPKASVQIKEGKALFLSSVDMLKGQLLRYHQNLQVYMSNAQFFRSCIENFALDDRLMKIKIKTLSKKEFKEGSDSKAFTITILNLVGLPFLVGVFGLARYLLRNRRSVAYERDFLQGRQGARKQ